MDGGMLPVETIQIGEQELAGNGVAGADDQLAHLQLPGLGQLGLAGLQQAHGAADVLIEHFSLRRQGDAAGVPGEQPGLQIVLQLLDGLAHRGLGDIQRLRRGGDVAYLSHFFKDTIQFELDRHIRLLLENHDISQYSICHDYTKKQEECKGKFAVFGGG